MKGKNDSHNRYEYLEEKLEKLKGTITEEMIKKIINGLAMKKNGKKYTSATLLFTISKTKHICEGMFYFDNPKPSSVKVEID